MQPDPKKLGGVLTPSQTPNQLQSNSSGQFMDARSVNFTLGRQTEPTIYTTTTGQSHQAHAVSSTSAMGRQELKQKMQKAQFTLGGENSGTQSETTYKTQVGQAQSSNTRTDLEQAKKVIENNKKTSIVLGNTITENLPTTAQQAFTRPESATVNRNEGVELRANFKKPNFTLAEQTAQGHTKNYYDTSNTNPVI